MNFTYFKSFFNRNEERVQSGCLVNRFLCIRNHTLPIRSNTHENGNCVEWKIRNGIAGESHRADDCFAFHLPNTMSANVQTVGILQKLKCVRIVQLLGRRQRFQWEQHIINHMQYLNEFISNLISCIALISPPKVDTCFFPSEFSI